MWKICSAALAIAAPLVAAAQALAEDSYILRQDQSGLTLPGVTLPQGFDEVRAADGTSCRSSNAGAGAYADIGVIGANEAGAVDTKSMYGRVVIPLGVSGQRLDCRKLYDLEIQRLQAEVRLLKAGLTSRATLDGDTVGSTQTAVDGGFTNAGRKAATAVLGGTRAIAAAPPVKPRPARARAVDQRLRGTLPTQP